MDPNNLIKGNDYQLNEPCTGKIDKVKYIHATINEYVFKSESMVYHFHSNLVKTNVVEIPVSK